MTGSEIPDLVGKFIAVKYGSGERDFDYIEVVDFEVKAGRHFLVGKTISTIPDVEIERLRFCVAWDVVTSYYEFDSVEECHKGIAAWYPPKKKTRFWSS